VSSPARLSAEEIKELQELARSEELRKEFDQLRQSSDEAAKRMTMDEILRFLTAMSRLAPPEREHPRIIMTNAKL